jgi:hypothetical protein
MVLFMSYISNAGEQKQKKPRVVEIIGVAGAGKTTLSKALRGHPELFRLCYFPQINRIADAPFFIQYGLRLLPSLFRLYRRPSRRLSTREFAWLTILYGWPFILQKDIKNAQQVMVMDQGPVYLLAEIREFGPEYLKSEVAEKFWQEIYCSWAATLDLIVWLDTEDAYLMERIQTRAKGHIVKHKQTPIVFDFLDRFRKAYEIVVFTLGECTNGPRILRYDTSEFRPEDIVTRLLAELGQS